MNLLSTETSPYLRQHENNPVHWMPWGETALAKAQKEDKPIFLSVGYAACHWCHVMAHECFEDPAIAALMNQYFVCIKVDREERPDIDTFYQQSLSLMGIAGGWPLTMFLTPEAKPFWGGTYFPPAPRHGLPGLPDILMGIHTAWSTEADKIGHNIRAVEKALEDLQNATPGPKKLTRQVIDTIGATLLSRIDTVNGGFGAAPKFPQMPTLSFLWDLYTHTENAAFKSAVIQTLTSLCQGGIYDHVGGGIARYAVDQEWLVPHFEKMLYDNAQFIALLSEVCRETANPLFAARLSQTIGFLQREMMVEKDGLSAFAASLDADSADADGIIREGAFYIWTLDDINEALGPDAAQFAETYDITRFGNWHEGGEGINIPNRLATQAWLGDAEEEALAEQLTSLLDIRLQDSTPCRDDKILADWNGMMIQALTRAGFALKRPDWIALAEHVFSFIIKNMTDESGLLLHSFCDNRPGPIGLLDDYAQMGLAALALFEQTGKDSYLQQARQWADILLSDKFSDKSAAGFYMTARDGADLPLRIKPVDDSAVASGNGSAAVFLARLSFTETDARYADKTLALLEHFGGDIQRSIFSKGSFLHASLLLAHGMTIVLPVENNQSFEDGLRSVSLPFAIRLPDKGVGAEICANGRCLPAITGIADFTTTLKTERHRAEITLANDA